MDIDYVLVILFLHFLGDFILQSDWMAKNKSRSFKALFFHICWYSLPFAVVSLPYALINAVLHGIVDAITSRLTSYYYKKGDNHNFFVVIGLDQFIHYACLLITAELLF